LLLSPLDWALIESWKEMNVPLHVALRGIERAFDSHDAKARRRSVKSLLYCQEEVEAQFAEWLEAQRGAAAPAETNEANGDNDKTTEANASGLPFPREAILRHLAEARAELLQARETRRKPCSGELHETLARAAARLTEIEKDFAASVRPDAEQLEASLTDLEQLLDRAIRACIPSDRLAARRKEAEEQLRPYRGRMERATYEQTLDNLLAKFLREDCAIPRLSLFYL